MGKNVAALNHGFPMGSSTRLGWRRLALQSFSQCFDLQEYLQNDVTEFQQALEWLSLTRYPESVGRERSGTGQRVLVCQFQFPTKCKFQIYDSSVCCVEHGRTMESFCGLSSGRCCPRQTQTRFKAELQSRIEALWSQGCDRDSCALWWSVMISDDQCSV